jgi:hypothetical protein
LNKSVNIYGDYSTASAGSAGLWISKNYFNNYTTSGSTVGIAMNGSGAEYQVHIQGNICYKEAECIATNQALIDGDISDNTGSSISNHFIDLSGSHRWFTPEQP